jgi:hypothetical protein
MFHGFTYVAGTLRVLSLAPLAAKPRQGSEHSSDGSHMFVEVYVRILRSSTGSTGHALLDGSRHPCNRAAGFGKWLDSFRAGFAATAGGACLLH